MAVMCGQGREISQAHITAMLILPQILKLHSPNVEAGRRRLRSIFKIYYVFICVCEPTRMYIFTHVSVSAQREKREFDPMEQES